MKRRRFILFIILLSGYAKLPGQKINELDPWRFKLKMEITGDAVILDVRRTKEYEEGHIEKAINIDYKSDDFRERVCELDRSKTYFVYCYGGVRSDASIRIMQSCGFTELYGLKGGMIRWKAKRFPVVK